LSRVVEYPLFEYVADEQSSFVCRRCRQRSPSKRATRACGIQWGNRLEVVVQPPLLKNSWRNLSASPLLQKRIEDPWPPPLERWWPQERRRHLRRPPPSWRRQ
jgi:hypothetical protein